MPWAIRHAVSHDMNTRFATQVFKAGVIYWDCGSNTWTCIVVREPRVGVPLRTR